MNDHNKAAHIVYINCIETLQYSFASHLSKEFRRKGIAAIVNSEETIDVMEKAKATVVIISKNVSSSSFLDRLVKVLEYRRKNGLVVVPVYYGVNPLDVVVPQYASADWTREWSSALQELRDLPSHQSREDYSDCELVEDIVEDVYEKLFPTEQIGIASRLLEIEHLLCKQPWGIRRIGIWGMPGIGKTTLAKAIFEQISGGYEASCFIKQFDEAFHEKGPHRLLGEHFGKILKELPRACSSITRPSHPNDKLKKKRALVVLDDVRNHLVAESFLGGFHWFGPGSLIIITSSDKQVFPFCHINHVYDVQSLNEDESLQLFTQCAFGKESIEQNLLELSRKVIDYANGNPLALSFYGKELKGKKASDMEKAFLELKRCNPDKIHVSLKNSYETLDRSEKTIFLDIACFFEGENVEYVMQLLEGCGLSPYIGIDVLVKKCLVTISEKRLKMHNLIQNFARGIINGETAEMERPSRLWELWSIKILLEDDEFEANGDPKDTCTQALYTEDIQGIFFDASNLIFDVKPAAFENMINLRFLKIYGSNHGNLPMLRLPRGLDSLPYELRLFHWENYPLQSLPQDFDPDHLVELNMSYSQLQKLWGGTKNLEMLKMVRLCHSKHLTEIDGICKAQNIELIDLQGCTKLQSFPVTSHLQHLRVLNLSGCIEIESFPEVPPHIEELHLQGTGIKEIPVSMVTLSQHVKLNRELSNVLTEFSGVSNALLLEQLTSLVKVVSSDRHLCKLVCLNMKDCSHLRSLPHMVDLESLEVLDLCGCSGLEDIQGLPQNLKELYLDGTAIKELPRLPRSLEVLNAHGCVSLTSIPIGFEKLPKYYVFSNCFALSARVVSKFVKNALSNVERMAREYSLQEQKLRKPLAFSFCVPSAASKKVAVNLQPQSSVMVQLGPSWRSTLVGFSILVEVAFSEDYQEATGLGFRCVCRWKDKKNLSDHKLEKTIHCWTPREDVLKFQKGHMFVLCDFNLHLSTNNGNDPDIVANLVVFEFFPVNNQQKLLDDSCTITKCGVYVITSAIEDTSPKTSLPLLSLDHTKKLSDKEVDEAVRVIFDVLNEDSRTLFLYIACLFDYEEADLVVQHIAYADFEISSELEVLANKSLIHMSAYGVIVCHDLLQKVGREIVQRQFSLPDSSKVLDMDFGKVLMDSSSSLSRDWKYDVFLSVSEEDDRNNKIRDHLAKLEWKTFKDNTRRSKGLGPELVEAIRESRISIIVFSKNYASSSRCLDELVEIMDCKEELDQKVSFFSNVDPSDARQQAIDFGRAFENTCVGISEDKKQKWAQALANVANMADMDSQKWDDAANMIRKAIYDVLEDIYHTTSKESRELVGAEDHAAGITPFSSSESKESSMVGISDSSRKGEEINSSMVMLAEPPDGVNKEMGKHYYSMWQTLFEIDTKYIPVKPIGRGSYSVVCSAFNKETNEKVAIKKMINVFQNRTAAVRTVKEMNVLRNVWHQNIIALKDVMLPSNKKRFEDIYMVYELMNTDLHQIIRSSQSLSDDQCKYFLAQLLYGLKYLHSVNILHLDLKPSNLLLNANCELKIGGFGLARTIRSNDQFMTEYVVTRWFRAPELLLSSKNYGTAIDVWSVGCILAEILGRKPIFPGTDSLNQLELIINVLGTQKESDLQFIDNPRAQRYVKSLTFSKGTQLCNLYPEANPLAIDLLQRMLVFDPTKRISVVEALLHPYMAGLTDPKLQPPVHVFDTPDIDENTEESTLREIMWKEMLYFQ